MNLPTNMLTSFLVDDVPKNRPVDLVISVFVINFALEISAKFQRYMCDLDFNNTSNTLKQHINALPEDSVLFRTDFVDYHPEFVGVTLAQLTNDGVLVKLAHGIYAKPRQSKYGIVLPSVKKIVQAISRRDNAQVIPTGITALNALGLSTQVPVTYTYLTTGSERVVNLKERKVLLKRGVPKNFCYTTQLISLLVQALRALKQPNVGPQEISTIHNLISSEPDKVSLARDVALMPAWMKKIIKPMLNN